LGFLTGIELRRRIEAGEIEIYSLDAQQPFNMDTQVTEDSIDLRIAPAGLILKPDIKQLDYFSEDINEGYLLTEIPADGYDLRPLQPLLTQSLEAVCLPAHLVGLVVTRNSFARLGLMVTCMAPKFAAGIRWAFPFQLINVTRVPIRIYPYSPMAQLLISDMTGEPIGYRGKYQDAYSLTPPIFTSREQSNFGAPDPPSIARTFHIITKDTLSRSNKAGTLGPEATVVPQPAQRSKGSAKGWRTFGTVMLSTAAAFGFGISGNIIAEGTISYWKGVSLALIILLSALALSGAVVLQARKGVADDSFEL
jgi:deoxycytidine triphosphate deaminase